MDMRCHCRLASLCSTPILVPQPNQRLVNLLNSSKILICHATYPGVELVDVAAILCAEAQGLCKAIGRLRVLKPKCSRLVAVFLPRDDRNSFLS